MQRTLRSPGMMSRPSSCIISPVYKKVILGSEVIPRISTLRWAMVETAQGSSRASWPAVFSLRFSKNTHLVFVRGRVQSELVVLYTFAKVSACICSTINPVSENCKLALSCRSLKTAFRIRRHQNCWSNVCWSWISSSH